MPYDEKDYLHDKERVLQALDEIHAIQNKYKDVIAIPEVVSLHDVADYRLQTDSGIRQVHTLCDKKDIEFVLQQFANTPFITPEKFEDIVVLSLATLQQGLT